MTATGVPSRRDLIAAAALELFAARGYRATTMADIGSLAGIRGPTIYKHFRSKQQLLADIMLATMDHLIEGHEAAVATTDDVGEQLRRATETHVRYHARHRLEAFVGDREIASLEEPTRSHLLGRRRAYAGAFRALVQRGVDEGRFTCASSRLVAFALLDMGMGISAWYRPDGPMGEDQLAYEYGDMALRLVGVSRSTQLMSE